MTQKSLAEQIAEMQNNLKALDKLMQAELAPKLEVVRKKISSITVQYSDGTTADFIEAQDLFAPTNHIAAKSATPINRKQVVHTGVHHNWATRVKNPKPGLAVEINGVTYQSIADAGRKLNLHPCTVGDRVHSSEWSNWRIL